MKSMTLLYRSIGELVNDWQRCVNHVMCVSEMIEVVCNDRLGKKVRVKCKYPLKRCVKAPVWLCLVRLSVLTVCQSGGHDRRPEEADRGADGHALGQDRAQEMVRITVRSRVQNPAVSVIIMWCVCVQVHHIQGPRVTGRLYPSLANQWSEAHLH